MDEYRVGVLSIESRVCFFCTVYLSFSGCLLKATMAAFAWSVAVPASLYITRSLGTTVSQSLLRNPAPEPLDTTIDTDGALASAEAALRLIPISPTARHLRSLVESSAERLRDLLEAAKQRQERTSFSRIFRAPCFQEENSRLRAETDTLKSRVHLFLSVMTILPSTSDYYNYRENDGEEVRTRESVKEQSRRLVSMNMRRERARASFVRTFARTLSAGEEMAKSCDSSEDESSGSSGSSGSGGSGGSAVEEPEEGQHTPEAGAATYVAAALQKMLR